MDEEGFKLALSKVSDAHEEGELLELRRRGRGAVDEGAAEVDERVDEEGSKVLDDEDGAP